VLLVAAALAVVTLAPGCRTSPSYAPYENLPHGPGG
jgi:hypothetical protein